MSKKSSTSFSKQSRIAITVGVGETGKGVKLTESQVSNGLVTAGKLIFEAGFTGFSMTPLTGGWKSPEGRLVIEPAVTFVILSDALNIGVFRDGVRALAGKLRQLFEQSAVLVELSECEVALVEVAL